MLIRSENNFQPEHITHNIFEARDVAYEATVTTAAFTLDELEDGARRLLGNLKVANWGLVPDRIALSRERYDASVHARIASRIAAGESSEVVMRDADLMLSDSCYQRYVSQAESSNAYKASRGETARRELDARIDTFRAVTGLALALLPNTKGELGLAPFRLLYPDGATMLDYAADGSLTIHDADGRVRSSYSKQGAPLVELLGKRGTVLSS